MLALAFLVVVCDGGGDVAFDLQVRSVIDSLFFLIDSTYSSFYILKKDEDGN